MAHFAHINENNIVDSVIVAEQDFIDSGAVGNPSEWIQTSYNTHRGEHPQGKPLRKNYAAIGMIYDSVRDAFIYPLEHNGWILNEETGINEPPFPMPNDGKLYNWNEETLSWIEYIPPVF